MRKEWQIHFALAEQVKVTFWTLELAFPSCVALGKLVPFSMPQFSDLDHEGVGNIHLKGEHCKLIIWLLSVMRFFRSTISCLAAQSFPTLGDPMGCSTSGFPSLSFIISPGLLKLMSVESLMPSNHLIPCRPLLLLPSTFPSTKVFSKYQQSPTIRCQWG